MTNVISSTTLGRPESWFQRLVPDNFKSHRTEDVVDRFAGRLDDQSRGLLESSLQAGNPQSKALSFAQALTQAGARAEMRPLYAATLEGLEQIRQQAINPIVDLTAAVCRSADHAIPGAEGYYLADLTKAASVGLNAYAENPSANLLHVAADLEASVGMVLDHMVPLLSTVQPQLKLPLEVFTAARDYEAIQDASGWLRDLAAHPHSSVPGAFVTVLKDAPNCYADGEDFVDTLIRISNRAETPEIRDFADAALDKISDGVSTAQLLQEWKHS